MTELKTPCYLIQKSNNLFNAAVCNTVINIPDVLLCFSWLSEQLDLYFQAVHNIIIHTQATNFPK